MAEVAAHRDTIDSLPAPLCAAIVATEEGNEVAKIALVRTHRVRGNVAFFREMNEIVVDRDDKAHLATAALPVGAITSSRQRSISRNARSAIFSRFTRLSFTRSARSSTNPKFAFIGWKCLGSASRR